MLSNYFADKNTEMNFITELNFIFNFHIRSLKWNVKGYCIEWFDIFNRSAILCLLAL